MAEMEGSTSVVEGFSTDMAIASPSISDSSESEVSEKSEEELYEVEKIVGMSKNRVSARAALLCAVYIYTNIYECIQRETGARGDA